MRILVVTSQFPIAGDPLRGRPILQTVRELARIADLEVVSPVAVYPRWARPSSYPFHEPDDSFQPLPGVRTRYVSYGALPKISRAFNGWSCARALRREIRNEQFDVVLGYWIYPDCVGALAWGRQQRLPVICGTRGSDLLVPDGLTQRQKIHVVSSAERILAVSRQLAEVACRRFGAEAARVAVISNGCDTAIFRPGDRQAARAELSIAAEARLAVYVGRLVFDKGLRELVASAAALGRNEPRLRVVLVGEGPLRAELTSAIGQQRAPVTLVGAAAPAEVARWMTAANVFTLPSYSEGNPNVVIEALACGRPVVATNIPGIAAVTDKDNAVLVPPRDSAALGEALRQALSRDWDETGISARHSRSWATVAADTLAECQRVVDAHGGR